MAFRAKHGAIMLPASIYPAPDSATHSEMANAIRALAMDAVEAAKSGHPGMPMGMADVATVLFTQFLKYDPKHPTWPDRDRFVLSAGHGSMLQYALLYLTGYERMPLSEIKKFRQLHSHAAGHPEVDPNAGIETTTGPLGQGISTAVGMALAERMLNARYPELVEHYTYVIASDGDLMEGISHEACSFAGHLGLNKLIVLYDDNGISIDGETSLSFTDNTPMRFQAYGWNTWKVDGHDAVAVSKAIAEAQRSDKPAIICCKTTIGYGAPTKAGKSSSHGAALGADEIKGAREALQWPHAPFEIPERILNAWRSAGSHGAAEYVTWEKKYHASSSRMAFDAAMHGDVPAAAWSALADYKKQILKDKPKPATRAASNQVLEVLAAHIPSLVGGSADLTGSNLTKTKVAPKAVQHAAYDGSYIYYGVREHGMAAAMNGLALHGGFIPYGGTFFVFSDYCRPAIRLAALMQQRVIHVMTHDSIGLGEDGPTHQPVEHLSSLRAMPNLCVFRPADAIETAECWELALRRTNGPSILALSRQNLPTVRTDANENLSAKGAYVLSKSSKAAADVVIMSTGSEITIAIDAQKLLEESGISTRVVSVPCMELFAQQSAEYQASVLPLGVLRVAVEAGAQMSWDKYLGQNGLFIGMDSFGASAPYEVLYQHFGLTAANIAARVKEKL